MRQSSFLIIFLLLLSPAFAQFSVDYSSSEILLASAVGLLICGILAFIIVSVVRDIRQKRSPILAEEMRNTPVNDHIIKAIPEKSDPKSFKLSPPEEVLRHAPRNMVAINRKFGSSVNIKNDIKRILDESIAIYGSAKDEISRKRLGIYSECRDRIADIESALSSVVPLLNEIEKMSRETLSNIKIKENRLAIIELILPLEEMINSCLSVLEADRNSDTSEILYRHFADLHDILEEFYSLIDTRDIR